MNTCLWCGIEIANMEEICASCKKSEKLEYESYPGKYNE